MAFCSSMVALLGGRRVPGCSGFPSPLPPAKSQYHFEDTSQPSRNVYTYAQYMSVLYTNCFGLPPAAVYPPPTIACSSLNCTQRYRIASCRLGNRVPRCHIACGYTTFQSWAVLRRVPEDDTQKLQWVLSTNVSRRRRPPAVSWVLSSTLHAMCGSALAWPAAAPRGNNHMWSEVALLLRSSAARAARTGPALSRLAGPGLASATHQKIIRKSHFQMFFRGIFEMHMFSVNSSMSGSTHKSQGRPGPPKSQSCRSAPPTRQPTAPSSLFALDAPRGRRKSPLLSKKSSSWYCFCP